MMLLDFVSLDRSIMKMAAALEQRDRLEPAAYQREESSHARFVELGALRQSNPRGDEMVDALRAWVAHLTVARVAEEHTVAVSQAWVEPDPDTGRSALDHSRDLVRTEALAQPAARSIEAFGGSIRDALVRSIERRAEAKRLLLRGVDPPTFDGFDEPRATQLANVALDVTDGAFHAEYPAARETDWLSLVRQSVAREAGEGWPARVHPRWLLELFDAGRPFHGVALGAPHIDAELVGASTFARALGQLGRAFALADRPSGTPWSLVRCPRDPLVSRHAALFASVLLEPAFHRRKLGLGRDRAARQAKEIGRAALIWLRVAALRALAWPLLGTRAGLRDYEDLAERALGRPMRGNLLGVVPRLRPEDLEVPSAMLEATLLRNQLRDRFDEDWFDNPGALEQLRHLQHSLLSARPTPPTVPELQTATRDRLKEIDATT